MENPALINSVIVGAFVKAYENYREPGDSFRSAIRVALVEVAPLIVDRCIKMTVTEAEKS